jgi:hypothetical protein
MGMLPKGLPAKQVKLAAEHLRDDVGVPRDMSYPAARRGNYKSASELGDRPVVRPWKLTIGRFSLLAGLLDRNIDFKFDAG